MSFMFPNVHIGCWKCIRWCLNLYNLFWSNFFDVGPPFHKCYTNVLCLLGNNIYQYICYYNYKLFEGLYVKGDLSPLYSVNKFVKNKSKLPQDGAQAFLYMGWLAIMWPSEGSHDRQSPNIRHNYSCHIRGDRSPLRASFSCVLYVIPQIFILLYELLLLQYFGGLIDLYLF